MEAPRARSGMEILRRDECLRLLAGETVGRLGVIVGGRPVVLPVNYALHGTSIVFRTGEGSKLEGSLGQPVTFEVDEFDVAEHSGWSVVVDGVAEEISTSEDWFAESAREMAAPTWLPGDAAHYIRIRPGVITGRRVPVRQDIRP